MNKHTENMMIVIIFLMLCLPTLSVERQLLLDLKDSQVLDKIIRDVIAETNIYGTAILISDFSSTKDVLIDDIIKLIMNNSVPITCTASNISSARNLWPSCHITSSTLLLFIYKSKDLSNFMKIQDVSNMFLNGKSHPKLLFLAMLEEAEADFQALLQYMWTKYVLDVTVLEVSKTNGSRTFTVHQYNPFSKEYTSQPYSPSVNWFPNKLRNLHGYPIKIVVKSRPGYNKIYKDPQGSIKKQEGHDYRALMTLKSLMNFTDITNPADDSFQMSRTRNKSIQGTMRPLVSGEVDTLLTTFPLLRRAWSDAEMTESFTLENWCVLMPALYKKSNFEYDRMLRIVLSFIILAIFWLASVILKFKSDFWRILNIFAMIISCGTPKFKIVAWSERVLFLSVVLAAAIHSSKLYADLTKTNVGVREEIQVENFRDLVRYGLTPVFHKEFFNTTFSYADGEFLELKANALTMDTTTECVQYLSKHGNISCFMESRTAMAVLSMQKHTTERELIVNEKLCYWSPPNGYYFYKYSPYRSRVGDIMLRSQQAGLPEKWFSEYFENISPGYLAHATKTRKEEYGKMAGMKVKIFIVVTCGYALSILVFFGELIVHRLRRQ